MVPWIIQSSGLRRTDDTTTRLLNSLERVGATWTDFGVIPFSDEVTNWENMPRHDREWTPIFSHVSTKALRIFLNPKLKPTDIFVGCDEDRARTLLINIRAGLHYDEDAFNMGRYIHNFRDILLNGDGYTKLLGDVLDMSFTHDTFIKPGKDLKMFDGMVLQGGETLRERLAQTTTDGRIDESLDELIVFAPAKKILAEWRFFVRGGHIVTGSQYRLHGKLKSNRHIPEYIVHGASELAWRYGPAQWYVMDVAMTEDLKLKVVEYNCVNCSGFYDADIGMIAQAL